MMHAHIPRTKQKFKMPPQIIYLGQISSQNYLMHTKLQTGFWNSTSNFACKSNIQPQLFDA